jgi:hypothetical protein
VPRESECENLLVPVCLAASHISYGSIRMEPVFMVLGQSAATAAKLAIDSGTSVQQVDYETLRERLLADKQVLEWTGPRRTTAMGIDPQSLKGLVIDDTEAVKEGQWTSSTSMSGYVGASYLHDGNAQKGELSATYKFAVKEPGVYEVRVAYTPYSNRATNVPITILHAKGKSIVSLNQRNPPAIDKVLHPLGKFTFEREGVVTIDTDQTDGYVVIDAVQLAPVEVR